MRLLLLAGVISGLVIGQASATPIPGCGPNAFCSANGTETFPGTYVGTVGNGAGDVLQIGNNESTGNAVVNPQNNPSIYEFYWAGGTLDIQEELGNNGTELSGISVALFSRTSKTDNSTPSISSALANIDLGYHSGGVPLTTIYDDALAAGYYSLDTYANTTVDPDYQVDFSAVPAVPEPMSVALLGTGLIGLRMVRRRSLV